MRLQLKRIQELKGAGETGRGPQGSASDLYYRLSSYKHYQATTVKTSTAYFKQ